MVLNISIPLFNAFYSPCHYGITLEISFYYDIFNPCYVQNKILTPNQFFLRQRIFLLTCHKTRHPMWQYIHTCDLRLAIYKTRHPFSFACDLKVEPSNERGECLDPPMNELNASVYSVGGMVNKS